MVARSEGGNSATRSFSVATASSRSKRIGPAESAPTSEALGALSKFPSHTTAVYRGPEPIAHASRCPKLVPVFQKIEDGIPVKRRRDGKSGRSLSIKAF